MGDISDAELGRLIAVGVGVGVPFLFLVSMAICLAAGMSLGAAALVALIPTFFGGWFYGGTLFVLRASDRRDRDGTSAETPVEQHHDNEGEQHAA